MYMSGIIPARFLILTAHLVLTITLLLARDANVRACLPLKYTDTEYQSKDSQFIVGLSLTIAFILLEFLNFFSGVSMFAPMASLLSILSHSSACVILFYFVFDEWDCDLYWWIFGFSALMPILTETLVLIRILVFRKGI